MVVGKNVYLTERADGAAGGKVAERIAGLGRDNAQPTFRGAAREAKYLDAKVQEQLKDLRGQVAVVHFWTFG